MTAEERASAVRVKYFGNGVCDTNLGTFKKFGQELALPASTVLDCIASGAGLARSEDFDAISWTADERSDRHARAGADYMARHLLALAAMEKLAKELKETNDVESSTQ